tara:strand:- start:270 stop:671 length:402 start_codon:yes stop_codon:yes gene_type:complete
MIESKKYLTNILAPVSLGEIIDKITILEIKKENMIGRKLNNINKELEYLKSALKDQKLEIDQTLVENLKEVNNNLWIIEDNIRIKESKQEFDKDFIELARSVYQENDRRASIKRELNKKYNSEIVEEKSYQKY